MLSKTEKAVKTRKKNREAKINSTYLNREWLFSRYCVDRMSMDKIANLCGVEYDVIWDALKQCKILINVMVGRYLWEAWVKRMEKLVPYVGV